jgi:hypothetical protein
MSSERGVVPLPIEKSHVVFFTSQCAGISPSHSTPESFMGTVGSRPLVTARVMRAVRFSWSNSISRSFFATSASIRAVSRSRNAAMARCSDGGGTKIGV